MNLKVDHIIKELVTKTSGISLKDFPMTVRLYHCLKRGGYITLTDVIIEKPDKFLAIRNFGTACEQELSSILQFVRNSSREDIIRFCRGKEQIQTIVSEPGLSAKSLEVDFQDCSTIEYAVGKQLNTSHMAFLNNNGEYCEDMSINELGFSSRTHNRLIAYGVSSVKQVASMKYRKLIRIGGLGKKGLDEIVGELKRRIVFYDIDDTYNEVEVQTGVGQVISFFSSVVSEAELNAKKKEITIAVVNIRKHQGIDGLDGDGFMLEMAKTEPVLLLLRRAIIASLSNKIYYGVDQAALIALVSRRIYFFEHVFKSILEDMIRMGQVRIVSGKLVLCKQFLLEWIGELEGNAKLAIDGRCKGLTLEEIGKQLGLTRERVRQLISATLKKCPELYEDDYAFFLEKYNFDREEFCALFSLNSYQLNYLLLSHKRGTEDVQAFMNDNMVPYYFKERVPAAFRGKVIILDGECVPLKRETLVNKLLKGFFSNSECSVEEFEKFYQTFLKDNGVDDQEALLFPNSRAFEARITDSTYSLMKFGRKIRYFDTGAINMDSLLEDLDICRYKNMELSTLKLVRDWPAVMEQYDIRDEYELHNLIRKRIKDVSKYAISVTRMPFITVGEGDRTKQVEDLLLQMAPVTSMELAKAYEEMYGVRSETVLANFFRPIDLYYHNGVFDLEQKDLSEEEYGLLRSALTSDIYLWDEITEKYRELTKQFKTDAINAMTLKKLGYRVYSRYVISSKYPSAEAFFTTILLKDRCVDLNEFKQGVRSIQSFHSALSALRDALELIEVDKEVYYRFDYLADMFSVNSKTELLRIGQEVLSRIEDTEYFSVDAVAKNNMLEDLPIVRGNKYILNSIIRVQTGYKTNRIANAYIATRKENDLSQLGLITYITKKKAEVSMRELLNTLRINYEIVLDRPRVFYVLQDSKELIYDDIFDYITCMNHLHNVSGPVYLSDSRFSKAIAAKKTEISLSEAMIAKYYWNDKYEEFVDYCGMNGCFLMRDILKLDFRTLSESACRLNISKGTIADIVEVFMEWVHKLSSVEEDNPLNESIVDLFFK